MPPKLHGFGLSQPPSLRTTGGFSTCLVRILIKRSNRNSPQKKARPQIGSEPAVNENRENGWNRFLIARTNPEQPSATRNQSAAITTPGSSLQPAWRSAIRLLHR